MSIRVYWSDPPSWHSSSQHAPWHAYMANMDHTHENTSMFATKLLIERIHFHRLTLKTLTLTVQPEVHTQANSSFSQVLDMHLPIDLDLAFFLAILGCSCVIITCICVSYVVYMVLECSRYTSAKRLNDFQEVNCKMKTRTFPQLYSGSIALKERYKHLKHQ